jgi:heat shock protein HtpX
MIHLIPRFIILVTWIFLGPSVPVILTIVSVASILIIAAALRRQYQKRTVALLGIFVMMLVETVQVLLIAFGIARFEPLHQFGMWNYFITAVNVNIALVSVGMLAAACSGIYVAFGRSRMNLAKAFPQLSFMEGSAELSGIVESVARSAHVKVPQACLVDSGIPGALTIRSAKGYVIAVTVGLLESLDKREVEACVAHEIAHLKNNDFRLRFLATMGKIAFFARPLSYFIEPAVYRTREYLADKTAAVLSGGPDALMSALSKLQDCATLPISTGSIDTVCLCNLNSASTARKPFEKHPDLVSRIRLLSEMKRNEA